MGEEKRKGCREEGMGNRVKGVPFMDVNRLMTGRL